MNANTESLSLLVVEDRKTDFELMMAALEEAGYDPKPVRVEAEADYLAALDGMPDLIISDYALPQFNGLRALALLRERKLDIPFILVSGTIGEELAVEAMRNGAADYLLKDRLGRLGVAVGSALEQKRLRTEAYLAGEELREMQLRLGAFLDNSPALTSMKDIAGRYLHVNRRFEQAFGLRPGQASGKRDADLFAPAQAAQSRSNDRAALLRGAPLEFEENVDCVDGPRTLVAVRFPLHDAFGAVDGVGAIATDVTERRREEELYRATFNQNGAGIAHTAMNGVFLRVNQKLCDMLGYSREELVGKNFRDVTHPEDAAISAAYRGDLLVEGGSLDSRLLEKRYLKKDGNVIWVSISASLIKNADGQPEYFVAMMQDISDRKAAEAKFRATFDHAAVGIVHTGIDRRYLAVNQKFCDMTGYSSDELLSMSSDQITYVDDLDGDVEHVRLMLAGELSAFTGEKRFVRKDGTVLWVNRSVSLVRDAAGAPLYFIRVFEDITGEISAREALRESERFAKSTIDGLSEHLCVLDENGVIITVNNAWREFAAANSAHLLRTGEGAEYLAICEDANGEGAEQARELAVGIRAVLDGRRDSFELEYPCHSLQEQRWFLAKVTRFHGAGPVRVVITHSDISARVLAEARLRESEIEFRTMFESAAVGKAEVEQTSGRFLRVNPKLCEITGYTPQELCTMTILQITHPADRMKNQAERERLIGGEIDHMNVEKRYVRKDGGIIWVNVTASLMPAIAGTSSRSISTIQDITRRKKVERMLLDSESRFRSLTELSADWYWEQDADYRFVKSSARLADAAGNIWDDEFILGKTRWELPYVEMSETQWNRHRADLDARRVFRDFELKQIRPDGSPRYVSVCGQPVFEVDGRFRGYRGVGRDITERKDQENRIARLSRIRAVLSGINSLIVRVRDRSELFEGACQIAVGDGQFGMAWIGMLDAAGEYVMPVASFGDDVSQFVSVEVPLFVNGEPSHGATARALRGKCAVYTSNLAAEPAPAVGLERRQKAIQLGYRSRIVLPLILQGNAVGHLSLYTKEAKFFNDDELKLLNQLAGDISFALEYLDKEEKLNHLAYYDVLTGLPNRTLFQDRLRQTLVQAQRQHWTVGVAFIDLDGFKFVNDTLGHAIGDKLLRLASDRLTQSVRSGDTVARFGGDEFAIILSDLANAHDASLVAQKILNAFAAAFVLDGNEVYVTASIGITLYPLDSESLAALLKNADTAMYGAKSAGRNNYQFYTAEMNQSAQRKIQLEARLRRAVERQEFVLQYQPKVDVISGNLTGFEALIRWQSPDAGLVSPAEFIPLLEETGLIVPVGEWVLRAACRQIEAWRAGGLALVPVAVNLSGRQFQQVRLDQMVAAILRDHGVDPQWIEFEITESSLVHRPDEAIEVLNSLKALGISISIDDFGTGYSSLSYLKRFPLDALKVDRTFVRDVTTDADDAAIVRAVVTMAHSLHLKVIAEGVETEEQLAFLRANRCDDVQGYLFAKPLAAEDAGKILASRRQLYVPSMAHRVAEAPAVLLVDDDQDDILLLEELLKPDGYRVLTASGPKEAFDLLSMNEVGVVISDQNMAEMRGVEFLRRVRVMYPKTARIMLTGQDDAQTMAAAINQGEVYRFFVKQRDDNLLRKEIRNVMWRRESETATA
jgi:diguanylate cyclase (GGDEF)-like protein/PAS domain S-box-containing protein